MAKKQEGREVFIGSWKGWTKEVLEFEVDGQAEKGTAFCDKFGWTDADRTLEWLREKEVTERVDDGERNVHKVRGTARETSERAEDVKSTWKPI